MKKIIALALALITLCTLPAYARDAKAPYDVQFLDTMAEHHRGGIKMMQLAVDKAQSADVKQMAQKGIDDQTKEINDLKSMRNSDAPEAINMNLPGMMPKEKMEKEMAKLEAATGSDFDKHFLQSMIKHHSGAVKMSDDAMAKAKNADVKAKAKEMHDKQKTEISDMENMLKGMK
jgi:uncharacterized protein (DUF305 family)